MPASPPSLPRRLLGLPVYVRYGAALLSVGISLAVRLSLDETWGGYQLPFIAFFPSIVVSAWLGGLGPGLLATLLGALAADWWFLPPRHSLLLDRWERDGLMLAVFVFIGAFISALNEMLRGQAIALDEGEQRLRATLQSIGDGVIATDLEGRVTRLNTVAQKLTGWSEIEARGRPISDVFDIRNEKTLEPAPHPIRKVLEKGLVEGLAKDTLLVSRQGAETPIDDSVAPIRDDEGRVTGAVIVFKDVSGRREAEGQRAQILASERKLRDELRIALETGRMGAWEYWMGTDLLELSPAFLEIHGYSKETAPRTFETFQRNIHPEDRERVTREIREAIARGGRLRVGYRIVRPDGTVRWVEDSGQIFHDAEGRPDHLLGVCADVTERRRAEEMLRIGVEAAPSAMLIVDAEGRVVLANRLTETLLGYSREELIGRPVDVLVPSEAAGAHERHRAAFAADPAQRPMGAGRDLFARRKDGVTVPVEIGLSPVRTPEGLLVIASITDASDRRRVLQAERAAKRQAEEANRAKDEFLASLSHELRTPLGTILGWARMLRSGGLAAKAADHALEVIERSARIEARLVDSLLDVTRIAAGKMEMVSESVDLRRVVEAAVETVVTEAGDKDVSIATSIPARPVWVAGDDVRLTQILSNVLSNAVKFTPSKGHVNVWLGAERGRALIRVVDDGEGIAPGLLPHVFDRFRQGDTSARQGGLGIGLSIVRDLVQAHQGTVAAESQGAGKGSTFTISFPLVVKPEAPREEPAASRPLEEVSLSGVRVLVVEDDEDTRELMGILLRSQGASVRTAESAPRALALLEEERPDLLIADIGLPGEDGHWLIRTVRSCERDRRMQPLKAIALTAYAGAKHGDLARASGFDVHLSKPATPDELTAAIARALDGSRAVGGRSSRTES